MSSPPSSNPQPPPPRESNNNNNTNTNNNNNITSFDSISKNIVRPFGYSCVDCGYCKGTRSSLVHKIPAESSKSYGLLVDTMTPQTYEAFLARGWRRSGIHLYKPSNFESCCPTITIRLLAPYYQKSKSKSQSKVWKKMEKLLVVVRKQHGTGPKKSDKKKKQKNSKNKNNNKKGAEQRNTKEEESPTSISSSTSPSSKKAKTTSGTGSSKNTQTKNGIKTTKASSSSSTSQQQQQQQQQLIRDSGILTALETCTRQALDNVVLSSSLQSQSELQSELQTAVSQLLSPKQLTFKIRQPSKQDRKQGRFQVSCSVCAQLAGKLQKVKQQQQQSSSLSAIPSREELVQAVVQAMQQQQHQQQQLPSLSSSSSPGISIVSLEAHKPSGQIVVTLQCSSFLEKMTTTTTTKNNNIADDDDEDGDVVMRDVSENGNENGNTTTNATTADVVVDDKLGQWYQQHTNGKILADNDRRIKVTTIPAHQSALMAETHKLYAEYQHVVHQDPNPFMAGSKTKKMATTSDNNDNNNDNNNKQSSSASDDDNDNEQEDEQEEEESIDIDRLDWGNAPEYFKSRISSMLRSYIQEYDNNEKVQHAILSNYYSYYQFLVESPFPVLSERMEVKEEEYDDDHNETDDNNNINNNSTTPPLPCGTYHQHYKLGTVLIAVGVVDVLPQGLSSVYLYYSPSFSHSLVALGKYAILKEVEYTQRYLHAPYYYLGYYIESCQKMRYKGEYSPSELLCPVTYQWVKASVAIPKLQQSAPLHVCQLLEDDENDENDKKMGTAAAASTTTQQNQNQKAVANNNNNNNNTDTDTIAAAAVMGKIFLDIGAGMNITLPMLQESGQEVVEPILRDYLKETGPELGQQCLVKLT